MKKYLLIFCISALFISFTMYPQQYRWAKGIGGINLDRGNGITVDPQGNVYVVGTFQGSNVDFDPGPGSYLLTSNGWEDAYFAKYDSSGSFLWAKSIGGTNNDVGIRIITDEQGNIYTGGWFGSTQVDFDPGTGTHILSAEALSNIWLAKYTNAGDFIWAYSIGGAWGAGIHDICFDREGFLLTAGYFCGTNVNFNPKADPVLLSSIANSGDIFFAKYDTSGACMFAKRCSGSNYEVANTIRTDPANNIYVFGPFKSTVDFDPGAGTASLSSAGDFDLFLGKYSPSGEYTWAKRVGGTGLENSGGLVIDNDGIIYLSACFNGTDIDFDPGSGTSMLSSNGGADICLAKYDSDGNYIWADSYGGTGDDTPYSTSMDSENNIYQSGYFSGQNIDFDPGPGICNLSSVGAADVYFAMFHSSGSFVWAASAGGPYNDFSFASANDNFGNVFITGAYSGNNVDFDPGTGIARLSSHGDADIFFAKYSRDVRRPYLGMTAPDTIPQRFGTPDLISDGTWWWHGAPAFSNDGKIMMFVKYIDASEKMILYELDNINGVWSAPYRPSFASDSSDNCPVFLSDGNTLMFMSSRTGSWKFYKVHRTSTGWSEVQDVNFDYSSLPGYLATFFSVAADETLYFMVSSQLPLCHIYKAHLVNGIYTEFECMPEPINSVWGEGTPYISPDQEFLIFDATRPEGLGLHDIYAAFKRADGSWTIPMHMGNSINGNHEDVFPKVTPDGKFMFFNSAKPGDLGYNAYWVSSDVINKLNPLVSVDDNIHYASEFNLYQNYPNPFNPVTTIEYSVEKGGFVKLQLFNVLGCVAATLVETYKAPGKYSVQLDAKNLASGVYFYRLESGNYSNVRKMVVLR